MVTGVGNFEEEVAEELMNKEWIEAGGEYQIPYMAAASRILNGEYRITCGKCGQAPLRFYFHVFNEAKGTGTLWVWCPSCRTLTHLPRVKPTAVFADPFKEVSLEDFARMEQDPTELLIEKLDRLWDEGIIGPPMN